MSPGDRKLTIVGDGFAADVPLQRAPDLRAAVQQAIEGMGGFTGPADIAMKALALRIAQEIEETAERAALARSVAENALGDADVFKALAALESVCNLTKTVALLGPQLQAVLRDLGGAPAPRKALSNGAKTGGRLAQLRAAAGQD